MKKLKDGTYSYQIAMVLIHPSEWDEVSKYLWDNVDESISERELCEGGSYIEVDPRCFPDEIVEKNIPGTNMTPKDYINAEVDYIQFWIDI